MLRIGIILSTIVLLASCSTNDTEKRVIVRLTDSPGDYEAVNVDIQSVQVNIEGQGWTDLETNAGIYNLLELTDGAETVLADESIPAGEISQIRLILGDNNTVEIDSEVIDLTTPSAQHSGLKVNIHEAFVDGITYSILLDFDAARSVVKAGNSGKYNLKPVIRAIAEAQDGALQGTILPAEENIAVYAIIGEDTLGTSYAIADNASWYIGGLEAGSYTLSFDPGELSTYDGHVIENVEVKLGEVNDLGEKSLELK